jgi:hypothetical protein
VLSSRYKDTLAKELVQQRDYDGNAVGGWVVRAKKWNQYWIENNVGETDFDDVGFHEPRNSVSGFSRTGYSHNQMPVSAELMSDVSDENNGILKINGTGNRIPEWSRLLEEHGYIDRVDTDALKQDTENIEIPALVVGDGRPAVFAYLATHGAPNKSIAELFDIKKNTVRTNLSKFKSRLTSCLLTHS